MTIVLWHAILIREPAGHRIILWLVWCLVRQITIFWLYGIAGVVFVDILIVGVVLATAATTGYGVDLADFTTFEVRSLGHGL